GGPTRLLLLLALRREALVSTQGLRRWLAQLEREVSLRRLQLRPLTPDDITQLVHALADQRPTTTEDRGLKIEDSDVGGDEMRSSILFPRSSDQTSFVAEFSQWLFAETAGQPFFMAETVKML